MRRVHLSIPPVVVLIGALAAAAPGGAMQDTDCRQLFDFSRADHVASWQTVNDGVMGGRSEGGFSQVGGVLRFSGTINTNGGGFSSIRARLPRAALAGMNVFRLRLNADERDYRVNVQTDVVYRGRPVSYTAPIRVLNPGAWGDSTVFFSEFQPTVFGRRVAAPAFDPAAARVISVILSDGRDGPFQLELGGIDTCDL